MWNKNLDKLTLLLKDIFFSYNMFNDFFYHLTRKNHGYCLVYHAEMFQCKVR